MRAVVCEHLGSPETLCLRDFDIGPPGPDEVRLRIEACGINFPDLLIIAGKYQDQPELPFIPCGEVAGTVESVGANVEEFKAGDAVMAITYTGGLAECVNVNSARVHRRPAGMSAITAAAFPGVFGTSYHALKQRAKLRAGETLLVLGAAGGVGHAAVQLGGSMGARVIAAVSSDEKKDYLLSHGAGEVINYQSCELRESVKALTGGRGADVIYDPVGGDLFNQAMRCINWNGRLLVVGFASGQIPSLSVNLALLKGVSIVGVFYGRFEKEQASEATQNMAELGRLFEAGRIAPSIHQVYPLEQFADALNALTSRSVIGKVIVTI